ILHVDFMSKIVLDSRLEISRLQFLTVDTSPTSLISLQ
ncbi:hypothetical protein Tco_0587284, partial [Tanacetum coccineum]